MTGTRRRRGAPGLWNTLVGLVFASAGIAKLAAIEPEMKLFRSWGWAKRDMQIIGGAELLGSALLVTRSTQRLGAMLLSSTSVCVLQEEFRHGNDLLITPRSGLLLAALTGFIKRG